MILGRNPPRNADTDALTTPVFGGPHSAFRPVRKKRGKDLGADSITPIKGNKNNVLKDPIKDNFNDDFGIHKSVVILSILCAIAVGFAAIVIMGKINQNSDA